MRATFEPLGSCAASAPLGAGRTVVVRSQLRERGALLSSSLVKVGAGLVFLPIGGLIDFRGDQPGLRCFGIPVDLAFLIVALVVIAAWWLISGQGLKPARLVPSRSISQISLLMESFRMADFR